MINMKKPRRERGKFNNPYLKHDDIIRVGKYTQTVTSEVINEFFSPFIGIYETYKIFND